MLDSTEASATRNAVENEGAAGGGIMSLLTWPQPRTESVAYRLFRTALRQESWDVDEILANRPVRSSDERGEFGWRLASRSYYAEQAGLVTAAALAVETDDVAYRFDMAAAAADEARHADAFLRYAEYVGGSAEACLEEIAPLAETLASLPHLGKALVHTVLEGFAADEFLLLGEHFAGDPLAEVYRLVRRDERRHVAAGVAHLARAMADSEARAEYRAHAGEWLAACADYADVDALGVMIGELTERSAQDVTNWFTARHRARLSAIGLVIEGR